MKRFICFVLIIAITCALCFALTGCETQASRVSYNLSQEADNFNNGWSFSWAIATGVWLAIWLLQSIFKSNVTVKK